MQLDILWLANVRGHTIDIWKTQTEGACIAQSCPVEDIVCYQVQYLFIIGGGTAECTMQGLYDNTT